MKTILFRDGTIGRFYVESYTEGAFKGDPTAFVYRNKKLVWVRPIKEIDWIDFAEA